VKLAVCSLGDPLCPATWSGTTANVCRALQAAGQLGAALDSESYLPEWPRLGCKIISKLYYTGSRYVRLGRLERAWRARRVRHVLADTEDEDILHFCTHDLPPVRSNRSVAAPRQRHYVFIDGTWNLWRTYCRDRDAISKRLSRDIEDLDRASYQAVDHIFTIAHYVRADLIANYGIPGDKITVVGSGRGRILPFMGEKDYARGHILFVARQRFSDKGGEALLAGFALARQRVPELRLVVVGRDEYRQQFSGLPGITVHGDVSLAQLQTLFEQASLFAMPAANEPWGLVYLEALSCRVPVLGLRRLSLPEITRDGLYGFCLEDAEPATIADALCEAFADPAALARMGAAGQAHCLETFTWERTAAIILDTIARLRTARGTD
jgi:glycosyltransferase involved in cell wall biosynthesis